MSGIQVMREETKLEKLKAYKCLKIDLDGIFEELMRLRAKIESCTVVLNPTKTQGGRLPGDSIGNVVARLEEMEAFLHGRLNDTVHLMQECEDILEGLPHPHQEIMRLYYISDHTWDEVAVRSGYCKRQCLRYSSEAQGML